MERWLAKLITNILCFIILTGFTALPIKTASFFKRKGETGTFILSLIMCFGGGILLATYLLTMIPEIRHILERTLLEPYEIHYPLPELFTAGGFFFLVFLEKLVVSCDRSGKQRIEYDLEIAVEKQIVPNGTANGHIASGVANGGNANGVLKNGQLTHLNGNGTVITINGDLIDRKETTLNGTPEVAVIGNGNINNQTYVNKVSDHVPANANLATSEEKEDFQEVQSPVRSIILLLALSLDCLFEGLSLGLMRTTPAVWNMFIAIATHESVVVFTMGLELVKVHPPRRVFFIAVMFGLMCPIGGAIGTCVMEINGAGDSLAIAAGVLQAMTAGMFIYVIFFQILNGEISGHSSMSKLIAMVIGFGCMAGLVAIPGASPTPYEDQTGHLLDPLASQNFTLINAE